MTLCLNSRGILKYLCVVVSGPSCMEFIPGWGGSGVCPSLSYHTITLSHYHCITISYYQNITLPHYHTITLSWFCPSLPYHTITISYYKTLILSHYHIITLSWVCPSVPYHTIILWHYQGSASHCPVTLGVGWQLAVQGS